MCLATHTYNSQKSKFSISLQYIIKEVSDKVDFLHVNKNESLLQIDSMTFDGDSQNINFAMPLQYLQKKLEMMLLFAYR